MVRYKCSIVTFKTRRSIRRVAHPTHDLRLRWTRKLARITSSTIPLSKRNMRIANVIQRARLRPTIVTSASLDQSRICLQLKGKARLACLQHRIWWLVISKDSMHGYQVEVWHRKSCLFNSRRKQVTGLVKAKQYVPLLLKKEAQRNIETATAIMLMHMRPVWIEIMTAREISTKRQTKRRDQAPKSRVAVRKVTRMAKKTLIDA